MITIKDKKIYVKLLDKSDSFPFLIVHMPYLDSKIPS